MIPGVTTRNRLPRLGKIRLGEKGISKGGKEYPKALDHFSFVDVPEVGGIFPGQCRELYPVLLPADDEEVFFPTARKAYRKSGLFCACPDGETATRVYVKEDEQGNAYLKEHGQVCEDGEMFEMPCPGDECPYRERGFCKDLGRFLFMLPTVPKFGVYEISTTSFNSIVNVLNVTRAIRRAVGTVAGIPFALVLKPMTVQPEGKSKTVYVLDLEFRGSLQQLAGMGRRLKAAGGGALGLLEAPKDETPDDLMPHAGAALDAELGGPALPPPGKLAAEPGKGKLDQLADTLRPAERPARKEPEPPAPGPSRADIEADTAEFVDSIDDHLTHAEKPAAAASPAQRQLVDF